jgi:hypothetical protein|tara:strand:- start:361 stop:834 length:474 start_codon:yes stop_codon:yes gene_type:complete
MKRINFVVIVGIIVITTIMILIYYPVQTSIESEIVIEASVTINGKTIEIEIADEPDERSRGLMFRESLTKDTGMLFLFDREDFYSFWMMNVNFNLDLIWINSNGNVVHIERDVPSCFMNCPTYAPKEAARYVLELNSGVANELDLLVGSFVSINLPT